MDQHETASLNHPDNIPTQSRSFMHWPKQLLITAAILASLFIGFYFYRNSQDPIFRGKRISAWIQEFNVWYGPETPAARALGESGDLSERLLVRMLRARDSIWEIKLQRWLAKQSWVKIPFEPASSSHSRALDVCNLLSEQVSGTVPAITALIRDDSSTSMQPRVAEYAVNTLAVMGSNGIATLVQTLTHSNMGPRIRAAQLLGTAPGSGSDAVIRALQAAADTSDPVLRQTAALSLELIQKRSRTGQPSVKDLPSNPENKSWAQPVSVWDIAHGTIVLSTSGLYPGCKADDLFGSRLSSVGTPETGTAIFDDSAPDEFTHFIEWQTPAPVQVRSFGLIAAHETALNAFIRAFRGFKLYARSEGSKEFTLLHTEDVSVPYGRGYGSGLLVRFENLDKPVLARHFRIEFVQNGSGPYHGARAIELYGFDVPLDGTLIRAALDNQEPAIRNGVLRELR